MVSASERLRDRRRGAGLSIRDLAARAGVSPSTVWRIEAGRLDPTVTMLDRLLRAISSADRAPVTREALVSAALGRLTAAALLHDPERVLANARSRARAVLSDPHLPRGVKRWMGEWLSLLDRPLPDVVAALLDPTDRGYELRQNTPFTGVLSDEDRVTAVRQASRDHRAARSA